MNLYWQYPVITEKKFHEQNCMHPNYIGIPWATILDKNMDLSKMYIALKESININEEYFTCCQHIKFRELIPLLKKLNIVVLFTPHKVKNEEFINGIEIKPCPLYAVNVEDETRNEVFQNADFINRKRKYLYSFQGAYMSHYLTPIRKQIFQLSSNNKDDVCIKFIGEWHFDEIVYTENQNSEQKMSLSNKHKSNNTIYNELLLDSIFTLCPSGAGPNSIRLWESLAVGSIPVLLSDTLDLPEHKLWTSSVLFVAENDIHVIDVLLRSITIEEIEKRRTNCITLYNHFKNNFMNDFKFTNRTPVSTAIHDTPQQTKLENSKTSREIIHYCCGSYDTHNYGGVARYDYHIKMIYPDRKFFAGPEEKTKLLEYLKSCEYPLVITDNHLACDIPNDYDVLLVHHGCARRTDNISKNWEPYWRNLCVNGQNRMLKYRTPENTHILSISQDVYDCFSLYYGDEYKRFKNTKILHTSELNDSKYHDYATYRDHDKLQILGNWGGYIKGDIAKLQDKLGHKYTFNQLKIQPSSFRNIQMFNDVKQIMYLQNDIFLQLSASEGFSYTALDAIQCGMVVISTPVGVLGGDVPDDCFVKIDIDKMYDAEYIEQKIQYAWKNRFELSHKIRTWYMNNSRFEDWQRQMYSLINKIAHTNPSLKKSKEMSILLSQKNDLIINQNINPTLNESNRMFIDIIQKNKPFSIVRLGLGYETLMVFDLIVSNQISPSYYNLINCVGMNGVYSRTNDVNKLYLFAKYYSDAISNSDILAASYFDAQTLLDPNRKKVDFVQDYFLNKFNIQKTFSRTLEPFYQIQENIIPWTHYLKGKKVLIVHPFVESFKQQLENGFKIFKPPSVQVFAEDQEFIFYKSYITLLNNKVHEDWFQTYNIMCDDISKLDFEIALLGCGAYGLPLCNYIKSELNKSAIYIGGGLQLLFGVMGKRWESIDMWKKLILENDIKFIHPNENEQITNKNFIEGGSYW
jgi:hypothetical protein